VDPIKGTVLISGAGSGMGQLAARRFAIRGLKVAALDVNDAGLAETAAASDNISTWHCDVTDGDAVARTIREAEERLGPIGTLYNAAAIMPLGKLAEQDAETIHRIMDINYGGTVNVAKAVLPGMLERGDGVLVNFASMAGWLPILLSGAYNASKFAVVAFTEVLYHENRDSGVRFACVCPPVTATPLLEQGRATAWPKMLDAAWNRRRYSTVSRTVSDRISSGSFRVAMRESAGACGAGCPALSGNTSTRSRAGSGVSPAWPGLATGCVKSE
jgi:NAD(P)-dependent dehydrogenase (short-subunit alcohol dehydrogenase family)